MDNKIYETKGSERMKKRLTTIFTVLFIACNLVLASTFAASTKQFSDVPSSKYYAEAVYELAERNIIGGYPDGTFKPGNTITRGQAAAIITKMINLDTSNVKNPGFEDVTTSNGYYKSIAAMAEHGIISGYGDGRYGPNDPIKRGQMASILVKAFDLPRYNISGHDMVNPFKDVIPYYYLRSHADNILILYKFGIVGGTSPDKFSPNAFITRGQAAKMLKATEDLKPPMVTIGPAEIDLEEIEWIEDEKIDSAVFHGILVKGKVLTSGKTEDKIQIVPLKEGTGTLIVRGLKANKTVNKKYYVHIKKENGELKPTLEEKDTSHATPVELSVFDESRNRSSQDVEKITLYTMDGKHVSSSLKFEDCQYGYSVCFDIKQQGQFIATVYFKDGEEVRYGIEAKPNQTSFNYDIKVVKEQLSDLIDMGAKYNIGKHTTRTKNAEQMVTVTRDPGTNVFRATASGQKEGIVDIDFEHKITEKSCDGTDCYIIVWLGIYVKVERIGSIVNVSIYKSMEPEH